MIQRVYERAKTARLLDNIIIATDDDRIYEAARSFNADVRKTSHDHGSGTERTAEIAKQIDASIIINIQGDEPLLEGQMIDDLVLALQDDSIPMATLAVRTKDLSTFREKDIVKVVLDEQGFALYFSRSPIPYDTTDFFWQHIGIYGFQRHFLLKFFSLPKSRLEKMEDLEQLRALEGGYKIKVIESSSPSLSVDTPQDIIRIENFLKGIKND
jgi:3-deoxy-manno-octulosonate cytidylyltransferase (CMP-KDO synthetase)